MLPSQTSIHATQQHYARMHSLPVNFPSLRDTDVATPESFSGTKVVIRARRGRLPKCGRGARIVEIHTINVVPPLANQSKFARYSFEYQHQQQLLETFPFELWLLCPPPFITSNAMTSTSTSPVKSLNCGRKTSSGTSPAAACCNWVVYSNYPLLVCVPPRLYPISRSRHMREQLKHGTQPNAEDMMLGMNQM